MSSITPLYFPFCNVCHIVLLKYWRYLVKPPKKRVKRIDSEREESKRVGENEGGKEYNQKIYKKGFVKSKGPCYLYFFNEKYCPRTPFIQSYIKHILIYIKF